MGCKRPFEEMEFEELRFKHSRQLEYVSKPASFSEVVSCYNSFQEALITGKNESGSCNFQWTEVHEKDNSAETSNFVDKGYTTSKPLSLVTDSSDEEHASSGPFGGLAYSPPSPGYLDFDFPRRSYALQDDVHSSSLDCSHRRQVPVGPNHQASIPIWRGNINEKKVDRVCEPEASFSRSLGPDVVDNYNEEKLMGTCVIPMPGSNLSTEADCEVAIGRTECDCLDVGSVRCVRQHVTEKRETLRKFLGDEKFVYLGFSEMGEETSCRWSEEEEHAFREAVYSNPASLGRNFWKHLSALFPTRSKKEIVSYYFNVFMLRKRAAQNRSQLLEIDSDDDEWHGSNGGACEARDLEDDEDSAIESLVDQDEHDLSEEESEDDESSDDGDDYDGNVGHKIGDATVENSTVDHILKPFGSEFVDGCKFDPVDKFSNSFQEDCVFQDDSCMSFECQTNTSDSCGPDDGGAALRGSEIRSDNRKCPHSESDASPGAVEDHLYLSDAFDAKVWDARYITRPAKSFDLLPWNMIEDIFGECKDDSKTKDG